MSTQPTPLAAAIPGLTDEQVAVVRAMGASGLTQRQLMHAIAIHGNLTLHAAEEAKKHPLSAGFAIPEADFAALIAHMQDGGGVADDSSDLGGGGLAQQFWQSVLEANQAAFWPLLIELVKSYGLIRGRVRPAASGTGATWSGVGPRIVPADKGKG